MGHNDYYNYWSKDSDHSTSFVRECNTFQKNSYANYDNLCELDDDVFKEDDGEVAFNPNQPYSKSLTFGDFLPPILDSIVNFEDDMDELLQYAIMCSFDDFVSSSPPNYHSQTLAKTHSTKAQKQKEERKRNRRKREEKIRKQREFEFVYHGTESKNNEGIIKKGLIIEGQKEWESGMVLLMDAGYIAPRIVPRQRDMRKDRCLFVL